MVTTSPMSRSTLAGTASRTWLAAVAVVAVVAVLPAGASAAAALHVPRPADRRVERDRGERHARRRLLHPQRQWRHGALLRRRPLRLHDGVFTAPGVMATDWEDIARGPGSSLWIGDIGDNNALRNEIAVHRFDEPAVGASTDGSGCPPAIEQMVAPASYRLRIEDGPHDAETLLVDPSTAQVFIITKSFTAGALYAAPNPLRRATSTFCARSPTWPRGPRDRRRHLVERPGGRRAQLLWRSTSGPSRTGISQRLSLLARPFSTSMHPTAASRVRDSVSPARAATC